MRPDFNVLYQAITRQGVPSRVPAYEHLVDWPIIAAIMNYDRDASAYNGDEFYKKYIAFFQQMGYDYVPMEMGIVFKDRSASVLKTHHTDLDEDTANRGWVDSQHGPVRDWEDLDGWPELDDAYDFAGFERFLQLVPDGMKVIGGAAGGPFEHASFLMGLENLCVKLYEDPEFVERFLTQIGEKLVGIVERLSKYDKLGVCRYGDDMGYKSATMISPKHLRKYFFPWAKKVVAAAHKNNKPFLLHSCGNLDEIMDDLIDDIGIDAKHSFEDVIMPVAKAKEKWGSRVAIIGGIDVDVLCRKSIPEIREYTLRTLDACAPGGGYAAGSGNSIANYIPPDNYLAMMRAIEEFNGN